MRKEFIFWKSARRCALTSGVRMTFIERVMSHDKFTGCHVNKDVIQAMNLGTLLEAAAGSTPDRIQYSFLDRRGEVTEQLSCLQLYRQAQILAKALRQFVGCRQSVALLMLPNREFVLAFWGCLLAEIWPAPFSRRRRQTPADIRNELAGRGISAVLTKEGLQCHFEKEVPAFSVTQLMAEEASDRELSFARVCGEETAFIQFSSGSTQHPKGIVISHTNVLHNLNGIHHAFAITESDIGLCWLPLHHDMGLIGHVLQPVFSGIQNYFMTPADFIAQPRRWLDAISRYSASISGAPVFAYRLCTSMRKEKSGNSQLVLDLSCWRLAYCGSEKIDADVLEEFAEYRAADNFCPSAFYACYGLAESTLFVCGRAGLSRHAKTGLVSVGRPAAIVSIVDPDTGQLCSTEQCGEILIRSDSVAREYYRNRQGTESTFGQTLPGQQGHFMRSGDLGFIAEGELYISGRLKNVIKIRGKQIQAEELETAVLQTLQQHGIRHCVVVPVMADGAEDLAVMVEAGASDVETLNHCIRAAVCAQADVLPACIVHVRKGRIPFTGSGKVRRAAVARLLDKLTPASVRSQL
jgi:acyl-CoA synthetase (AMP-forming)/AMP-acid ligase II